MEILSGRLPDPLEVEGPVHGVMSVGVLNYVQDLGRALVALASPVQAGGWVIFSVPPDSADGTKYLREERLLRRRIYLRSDAEVIAAAAGAEPVKPSETTSYADLMSASGDGSLIQATVGSLGGAGRRWWNRAGLAA